MKIKLLIGLILFAFLAGCIQSVQPATEHTIELELELENRTNSPITLTTTVTTYDTPILPLFNETIPANSSKTVTVNAFPEDVPYQIVETNSGDTINFPQNSIEGDYLFIFYDINYFVAGPIRSIIE